MQNFSSKKRGNSLHSSRKSVLWGIGFVVGALFVLFAGRGIIASIGEVLVSPLYAVRGWFSEGTGAIPSYFRDRNTLTSEIESLQGELRAKQSLEDTVRVLESENNILRSLGGAEGTAPRIMAGIVARPPFVPYDAVLLDRGEKDGIKQGAVMYSETGYAIGMIQQLFQDSSIGVLFSTSGIETTAYILGPNIYTTAYGEGGGVIRVSVPQDITLTEGDIVLLPSLERGMLGKISIIRSEASEPEKNGFIAGDIPLQSLRFVAVGTEVPPYVTFETAQSYIDVQKASLLKVDVPIELLVDNSSTTATTTATSTESESLEE